MRQDYTWPIIHGLPFRVKRNLIFIGARKQNYFDTELVCPQAIIYKMFDQESFPFTILFV